MRTFREIMIITYLDYNNIGDIMMKIDSMIIKINTHLKNLVTSKSYLGNHWVKLTMHPLQYMLQFSPEIHQRICNLYQCTYMSPSVHLMKYCELYLECQVVQDTLFLQR